MNRKPRLKWAIFIFSVILFFTKTSVVTLANDQTTEFKYLTHFAPANKNTPLSTTWTVPSTGTYKVNVIGAGGDGGAGEGKDRGYTGMPRQLYIGAGGAAGGNGGLAVSSLYLTKGQQISIVINSSQSVFNNSITAKAGEVGYCHGSRYIDDYHGKFNPTKTHARGGQGGSAAGGNLVNITGINGGDGGIYYYEYKNGGTYWPYTGCGGDVSVDTNATIHSKYYTNTILKGAESVAGNTWQGSYTNIGQPGRSTPIGVATNIKFGGAGSGGSGGANYYNGYSNGGKGGLGQVGGIVIEKLRISPPTVQKTYSPQTNSVTLLAAAPEAQKMDISKSNNVIASVNGDTITCQLNANGRYIAKAILGFAVQTTEFEVTEIDAVGPAITSTPLPTGWAKNKTTTITLSDAQTPSGMQYQINGGAWTNYTAPFTYNFIASGSINVLARDKWGNLSNPYTITANQIDNTQPSSPVIKKAPDKSWHNDDVTVTIGGGSDAGSGIKGYQYNLDGNTWIDYKAPFVTSENVKITARSIDNMGLLSELANIDVNIDRIKPTGIIAFDKTRTISSVELTFTASDSGGSGVKRVRPVDGAWTDGDKTKLSVRVNGTYSFEAEDYAGNVGEVSTVVDNIDLILPVVEEINFVKTDGNLVRSMSTYFNKQVEIHIVTSDSASTVVKTEYQLVGRDGTIKEDGWHIYNESDLPRISRNFDGLVVARCTNAEGTISLNKEQRVTVEDILPTASHTINLNDKENGKLIINIHAQDNFGVASITLPDGKVVDSDTANYTVEKNGTFKFIITDKCGNCLDYEVDINNIERTTYSAGQNYNFTVSANNVTNFKDIVYVLNYDNKYFDIVNLCNGVNPTKTTTGEVPGTDITILEITPTKIKFKCNKEVPAGKSWSGVVNIITLKAKQNASSYVSVSTETK